MSSQPFQQWPSVTYPPPGGRHLDNCQVSSLLWVCGYIYFITPGNTQYLYCLNSNLLKLCIKYFNNLGFFFNSTLIFDDHKLVFGKMGKKKAWSISVYYWWMYESSSCWKKVSLFTLSKYVFWDAPVHFCAFTSLKEMQQRCISVERGKLAVHVWHL